jgi:hypothetical protein
MAKVYVNNSRYLEAISDMAEVTVVAKFGDDAMVWDDDGGSYTEEAQDLFNETYDYYETIIQKTLNVYSEDDK